MSGYDDSVILLAIDPSVNNLGWACCNLERTISGDIHDLNGKGWAYGLIHPQGLNIQQKWQDGFGQLEAEMRSIDQWPTHLVAEQPTFYGTTKGRIAAQLDHTIHLGQMVAGIAGSFRLSAVRISLLTATQWKGSAPKRVTRRRLEAIFGVEADKLCDDEVDAIMLAQHWLAGYFRKLKGPPLNERHADQKADLVRLVQEARHKNGNNSAWWGRISTILRRRADIGRGLARRVLRQEFQIPRKQIETILRNAS